ncbi:MAG: flagellar basal body rod protein FlgC [Verrucomicrobiota bacterium JB022]|nr:flagellar basal body rod protein FlgC [Verrucomicrobiota bacterium JB022]
MELIPAARYTTDALQAHRLQMDVVAQNLANAQTTRDVDGQPYQRRQVVFESYLPKIGGMEPQNTSRSVRVSEVSVDNTPGERVYMPNHPHADDNGMVALPNVKTAMEMVDLINVSRAYEANLSVIRTSRQMALQAMQI